MFNNEDENEELAPEEESFPVDNQNKINSNRANRNINQSSNSSDGNKLQETIGRNKNKNLSLGNRGNTSSSSDSDDNNEETNAEEEDNNLKKNKEAELAEKTSEAALKKLEKFGLKGKLAADVIRKTGAKEKVGELVEKAIKKLKSERKRRIIRMLMPVMPYILTILAAILIFAIIMSQLMLIMENLDKALVNVSTGIEKAANFMSGEGWKTEDEEFFDTLEKEYKDSLDFSDTGIDIPLIAATIHYTKLNDVSIYNKDAGELDTSIDTDSGNGLFSGYISAQEMKNFYYVANSKLGSIYNIWPGERKLIGHMVDVSISVGHYTLHEALDRWGAFFKYFRGMTYNNIFKVIRGLVNPYHKVREIIGYANVDTGGSSDNYFEYKYRNIKYEIQELDEILSSGLSGMDTSNLPDDDDEEEQKKGVWPAPNINMTINQEKYYNYLINVYIPGTYFSHEDYSIDEAKNMATEIFKQRDAYLYLTGEEADSSYYSGNNVSVSITSCNMPNVIETTSLYDYIRGALYAEGGLYNPTEYLKAQAIAIKNYLFAINGIKPDSIPSSLTIKSCQMNQVYCNVDKGCHSMNDGKDQSNLHDNYDTAAAGPDKNGDYLHPPITDPATLQKLREIVDSTLDQFIVKDGKIVTTEYRANCSGTCDSTTNKMDQHVAIQKAQSGETYEEILKDFYDGELATIQLGGAGFPLDLMYTTISSRFGWRNHPIDHCCKYHAGYDFDVPAGEKIYSVSNGVVTKSVSNGGKTGYGNYVEIGHGELVNGVYEYYTLYAHMIRTPIVSTGENVKMGQVIGNVGSTGASTGAHLHFEVFYNVNGMKQNTEPADFLKGHEFVYKNSSHFDNEAQCLAAGVPHC